MKIPKIIMQTWKTSEIPTKWKPSVESIQQYMPDYTHILMTDEDNRDFIQKHFPDFLPYYDAFPYNIQRADAIRYCFLFIYGGIYMDLDMELQKSLAPLFDTQSGKEGIFYVVTSGNFGSYITNSFMASTPRHPIWLDVIEAIKQPVPWWCRGKHLTVMKSAGPARLDSVVKSKNYPYVMLPSKLIHPCSICDRICRAPDTYIMPLEGCSWIGWDTMIYKFFFCHRRALLILLVLFIIIALVVFYYYRVK